MSWTCSGYNFAHTISTFQSLSKMQYVECFITACFQLFRSDQTRVLTVTLQCAAAKSTSILCSVFPLFLSCSQPHTPFLSFSPSESMVSSKLINNRKDSDLPANQAKLVHRKGSNMPQMPQVEGRNMQLDHLTTLFHFRSRN